MANMTPFDPATDEAELDRCGHCEENPVQKMPDLRCVNTAFRHMALFIASQNFVMAIPVCKEHWQHANGHPDTQRDIIASHPFAEACAHPHVQWDEETNTCTPCDDHDRDAVYISNQPPMHTSN